MSSSMGILAVCAFTVTGAAALEAQHPAPGDTVHLRFHWPAGTTALIETTRLQERVAESADTVKGSSTYRMNVQAHAQGLLISYDDFVFPPPTDTTDAAKVSSLAAQASAIVPKFIVDTAGAFIRIEDAAAVRAQFDSLLTRMLEPDEAAAAREGLVTMLTEESLSGLAAKEWNAMVGRWADADLVVGEVYSFEEEAALPMIPGAVVPIISEFSIVRRTSCGDAAQSADCVEIRVVSRPDPVAIKAVLAKFMEGLLAVPGIGAISYDRLDVEDEMVLVTEYSTLRPHSMRISKRVTGSVTAEGERSEVSQSDVRTYRYTYPHQR